jgi:hypothetical protein
VTVLLKSKLKETLAVRKVSFTIFLVIWNQLIERSVKIGGYCKMFDECCWLTEAGCLQPEVFLQLFVDPVALLLIGVLSLVLYVSRKVVAVQSKEGMLMNLRLLVASFLETTWATAVSATAGTLQSL